MSQLVLAYLATTWISLMALVLSSISIWIALKRNKLERQKLAFEINKEKIELKVKVSKTEILCEKKSLEIGDWKEYHESNYIENKDNTFKLVGRKYIIKVINTGQVVAPIEKVGFLLKSDKMVEGIYLNPTKNGEISPNHIIPKTNAEYEILFLSIWEEDVSKACCIDQTGQIWFSDELTQEPE